MPGSFTDYAEGKIADALFGGAALGAPASGADWHLGLFTVTPADDGTGGTEVTGGSYARVAVTQNATNWPAYAAGLKQLAVAQTYAQASADWGDVVSWGLFDASTGGNLWVFGEMVGTIKEFASDGSTDIVYSPAHGFSNTDTVRVRALTGTLPSGLSEGTTYYVRDAATDSFKLAASSGGAAIDIGSGSGLIAKITVQNVANGNTAQFNANAIKIRLF